MNDKDKIETASRIFSVIRKLNFPILKADFALAGEISGTCDSKHSISIACKKNVGALTVALLITVLGIFMIMKHAKNGK